MEWQFGGTLVVMVTGGRHWPARLIVVALSLYGLLGLGIIPAQGASVARASDSSAGLDGPRKTIHYLGYKFSVPKSWPVIDNSDNPRGCVRFDEHAVYLGAVSPAEFCPSWLLGATESMLIQPGPVRVTPASTEDPVAKQISVSAAKVQITATFDRDPSVIYSILASAGLPAPRVVSPSAILDGMAQPLAPHMHYPMAQPSLPATVASGFGLGFDACAAPSRKYMRAWRRHSPYRAVGIYIGGADRACAQPNLSRGWVRDEAAAGWRFMPLYAGPQAEFGQLWAPRRQGRQAAADAVVQAQRLGFGPRTPLYYDMEAYRPRSRLDVLRFLSAWTRTLHRLGYSSGVYSSNDSGIADLAGVYRNRAYALPDIIFDALWNGAASVKVGYLHAGPWAPYRRIHQFSGNVTERFGGDAINIDKDFLDVRAAAPRATTQSSQAVALPGGSVLAFYRSGHDQLRLARYVPSRGWTGSVSAGASAASVPSAVWTGSVVDVFYTGSGGYLWVSSFGQDGAPLARRRLTMMGVLGSAPRAVAQPGGVIDVFWRGSADDHLWHGQYTPGSGWNGPQGLGGDLATAPAPVVSAPGVTSVFWKGTDSDLWVTSRGLDGTWSAPRSLGMAPVGGPPLATAQPDGGIEVYWAGSGNPYLWECFYTTRTGWRGPRDLGGDIRSAVWPVTASSTVSVLWLGPGPVLDYVTHRRGPNWNVLSWQSHAAAGLGWIGSAPFAAAGDPGSAADVFWTGRNGALWTVSLTGAGVGKPVRLG
ncbi:MAG TPA: glycoside hydrolase domain-containing protein [Streptosporangiaceae bacterium]|jgi:hypothetical protein|nr:glycoside hydrolase domain-containing protein [Streptosporangiaceae bacterium]